MLRDLDSAAEITAATERLLKAAAVADRLPTPIEDLMAAAGLAASDGLPFDESVLRRAPAELAAAVRKLGLARKVHAMLDRRERKVYVNPDIQLDSRRRFRTAHEIGHHILPAQNAPAYADNEITLSWVNKMRSERDANQTGAELVFQLDLFRMIAADYRIGMGSVIELANKFGASYQAALRRYAETHHGVVASLVLDHSPSASEPLTFRRRETVCSEAWQRKLGRTDTWPEYLSAPEFTFVNKAQEAVLWETPASGELRWPDLANQPCELRVDAFSNHWSVLLLLWEPQRERFKRRRRLVTASG